MFGKQTVEDSFSLKSKVFIPEAFRNNGLEISVPSMYSVSSGYRINCWVEGGDIFVSYQIRGENVSYKLETIVYDQPNGGCRYFFECPFTNCGRKCTKLYLPPGADRFGCRKCHDLTYRSCKDSHKNDRFCKQFFGIDFVMFKKIIQMKL